MNKEKDTYAKTKYNPELAYKVGKKTEASETKSTLMEGKCDYPLPNIDKLKLIQNQNAQKKK